MSAIVPHSLQHLFDTLPGCWGCKDLDSNFIYANQAYTSIVGLRHKEDIVGRSDFDMPCDTVESAPLFRAQDQEVICSGKRLRIFDIHRFSDGRRMTHLFTKAPLLDSEQNIIGTLFHGQLLHSRELLDIGMLLTRISTGATGQSTSTSYTIGPRSNTPALSRRQEEILFLTLRGRSARQTAAVLGITVRTVEQHFRVLKDKFQAHNKSELIDRAIGHGYLYHLPSSLCTRSLSVVLREN
jgi:DNA-binding CsgD family transcriptional regulator